MLRAQDLARATIAEDTTQFRVDHTHQGAQATILAFPRGQLPALALGAVLATDPAQVIAHVRQRIDRVEGSDHLIPVGRRETK